MYVNFTARTNEKREINKELEAILKEKIPDFDTSSYMDEEEDNLERCATFFHGNDGIFYDENGNQIDSLLEQDKWEERMELQRIETYEMYLELLELKSKKLIITCWISDNSQFGIWWNKEQTLIEIENSKRYFEETYQPNYFTESKN